MCNIYEISKEIWIFFVFFSTLINRKLKRQVHDVTLLYPKSCCIEPWYNGGAVYFLSSKGTAGSILSWWLYFQYTFASTKIRKINFKHWVNPRFWTLYWINPWFLVSSHSFKDCSSEVIHHLKFSPVHTHSNTVEHT